MTALVAPNSVAELVEAIRATPRLLAVGRRTKPRLSVVGGEFLVITTERVRGIVEYDPAEFTVTTLAGTPVSELAGILESKGQYLPFDPPFVNQGATIGGTVAAGVSGPGRFRFGGIRDFILGIRFVDGQGRHLRAGGRVVKNAAGFDLPKFFVGSLGRFGVLTEVTLKVFPRPRAAVTLRLSAGSLSEAWNILITAATGRWECDALDVAPDGAAVHVRFRGGDHAVQALAADLLSRWQGERLPESEAEEFWAGLREFSWAREQDVLIKVPFTPSARNWLDALAREKECRFHLSAAGSLLWLAVPDKHSVAKLQEQLREARLAGLTLRGPAPLRVGFVPQFPFEDRVKAALDPAGRFPALHD